jgi:hypothetical protein
MSDPEDFLRRWSRRKREAEEAREPPAAEESAEKPMPEPLESAISSEAGSSDELANLPTIDSIDAETDIRAFLAAGVSEDVKRAALRRAWASDPAIRDFVGLSEDSGNFNGPDAIPGFGPLAENSAQRLLSRVMGDPKEVDRIAESPSEAPDGRSEPKVDAAMREQRPDITSDAERHIEMSQCDRIAIDSQNEQAEEPKEKKEQQPSPRRHGGALPK